MATGDAAGAAATEREIGRITLPIRSGLDQEDLDLVPKWDDDYEVMPDVMEKLAVAVRLDYPVLLWGPKGTGKTSAVRALAALLGQPVVRFNLNSQTTSRHLVGTRTISHAEDKNGNLVPLIDWVDGPVTSAIRNDRWLLIDEFDAATPGVMMALQPVLEDERSLLIPENHEIVSPPLPRYGDLSERGKRYKYSTCRNVRFFATANTNGQGDETGLYRGTNAMNAAQIDRFVVIKVDHLPQEQEIRVVKRRAGIGHKLAEKMVWIANEIRKDSSGTDISVRQLIQWARIAEALVPEIEYTATGNAEYGDALAMGYQAAIGSKLNEDDSRLVSGIVQRELGIFKR